MKHLLPVCLVICWTLPLQAEPDATEENKKLLKEMEGFWVLESMQDSAAEAKKPALYTEDHTLARVSIWKGRVDLIAFPMLSSSALHPRKEPGQFDLVWVVSFVELGKSRIAARLRDGKLLIEKISGESAEELDKSVLGDFRPDAGSTVYTLIPSTGKTFSRSSQELKEIGGFSKGFQGAWVLADPSREPKPPLALVFVCGRHFELLDNWPRPVLDAGGLYYPKQNGTC